MGCWQLEVARMALYISFPVYLFHWFNQPENFADYVEETKKRVIPPSHDENRIEFQKFVQKLNQEQEEKKLKEMEEKYGKKVKS